MKKHKYLLASNYYEDHNVHNGRDHYYCEHCDEFIPKGMSHKVHKFYPEFNTYRTHHKCVDGFMASLREDNDEEE